MKKAFKSMLGVTLLEVLLVLVIASLILVMSIRYYQSASENAKVNSALETLQGIMAGVDSFVNAGNSLTNASCTGGTSAGAPCTGSLGPFVPSGAIVNPWPGSPIVVSGGASFYTITFPNVPGSACSKLSGLATQNAKVTTSGTCPAGESQATMTFTVVP